MPHLKVHPQVFQFLSRGADLMLPGVYLPTGGLDLLKNARLAVVLSDTNLPVAVGTVPITTVITKRSEMVGKGLIISHVFGDELWRCGSKTMPDENILSRFSEAVNSADEEDIETLEAAQAIGELNVDETQNEASSAPGSTTEPSEASEAPNESNPSETTEKDEEIEEEGDGISVEAMDLLITTTFLQALKRRLKDKDLPMLASKFWAEYCLPCRPKGSVLQWKRTSWKKFISFLEEQVRIGLIAINTTDQGVTSIVAIIRDHPKLESFRTLPVSETAESEMESPDAAAVDESKPLIQEFWTLHKKLEFLLVTLEENADGAEEEEVDDGSLATLREHLKGQSSRTRYFNKPQVNAMLRDYIILRKLADPNDSKSIVIDLNLCSALFPGTQKQAGNSVSKKDLMEAFNNKLIPIQMVTVNGEVKVEKGNKVGSITILVESRGGSKVVTRLQGLHHFGLDIKEVSKKASKKFASAAGTDMDPTGHEEILLQGNLEKQGPAFFIQEYNIPLKHIKVEVKGNVKKKGR